MFWKPCRNSLASGPNLSTRALNAAPAANVDGVCEAPSLAPVPELAADRW
jgi:hypothetical protein